MYKLNKTLITVDGKEVETYGITCGEYSVTAISTDRLFVEKMIADFNNGQLDLQQLGEVVEDML